MRSLRSSLRWAAVPAAVLTVMVYGAAGPAQAQPGDSNHGQDRAAQVKAERAGANQSRAATTFDKPNHWQAQADPDGMNNGGVDQAGGTGGTIGYQDGNNGSGNDIDCEDDNRGQGVPGHCKDKPAAVPSAATPDASAPAPGEPAPASVASTPSPDASTPAPAHAGHVLATPAHPAAEVLGISAVRPRTQPHLGATGQVAGISAEAEPIGGVLPNTGAGDLAPLAATGAGLLCGGAGLLMWRRRLSG